MNDDYLKTVRRFYPNATTTTESVDRLLKILRDEYDLGPRQIMQADSICSDDVNAIEYPKNAAEMLGPFQMGGLGGYPFTGLAGMNAFAGHVPEDGAVFVYYAPHIGVTKDGAVGVIRRFGQHKTSGCCGAAKGALDNLLNDKIIPGNITHLDFQFNAIEQIFLPRRARIESAADPLIEATEVMYEAIEERINIHVARTKYPCKYLILMGAILINGDEGEAGSFDDCRRFEITNLETRETRDLLDRMRA